MGSNPMQLLNSLGVANQANQAAPARPDGHGNAPDGPVGQAFRLLPGQGNGQGTQAGVHAGMNALLDGLDLSAPTEGSMLYARAQFEVSARSIQAMMDDAGNISYYERNFSMSASFEFLQVAGGGDAAALQELDGQALMDKIQDLFTPEKTAQRILDFALSQYAPEGEDSTDQRQAFADRIGDAIQKGFDEAQGILGRIEERIQEGIDQTHERVFRGLDEFVESGLPEDHAERSDAIRKYAEQFQRAVHVQYSRTEYSRQVLYTRNGAVEDAPDQADRASRTLEAQA